MSGLFVKLDAEYASDDKLIEAGPLAELLYLRALCFCKRTMSDGKIKKSQLAGVALGIPSPSKQAHALVTVGAWRATTSGWVINAWLKRNKSADQIKVDIEARRVKSLLGNHQRWHVQEGKPDPTCEFCNPPQPDPADDPHGDPQLFAGESTEPEPEEEPEPQPEEEPTVLSPTRLTVVRESASREREQRAIDLIVDALRSQRRHPPDSERAWRKAVRQDVIDSDGDLIAAMAADGTEPDQIALFVLGHGTSTEAQRTATAHDPDCPDCDQGFTTVVDETGTRRLAPCPRRTQ